MTHTRIAPPSAAVMLAELIQEAIAGAVSACVDAQHLDTGMPIYDQARPCPVCATDAVMTLFPHVDIEEAVPDSHDALNTATPVRARYLAATSWDLDRAPTGQRIDTYRLGREHGRAQAAAAIRRIPAPGNAPTHVRKIIAEITAACADVAEAGHVDHDHNPDTDPPATH